LREDLIKSLGKEILVLDGAMGTQLQKHGITGVPEAAVLESPDLVRSIHRSYADAGADIISTNTFGANRIKLKAFGLENRVREINHRAAVLAREGGTGAWVAGCIGPTGQLLRPLGPLDFEEVFRVFEDQVRNLAEAGVDLVLLETFSDLREIKAAVLAIREHTNLPVFASMTYGDGFLTLTGTDPQTAVTVLESLRVDAVGVNCSTGPEPMLEIVGRYAAESHLPVLVEPNAGMPDLHDREIRYPVGPGEMAGMSRRFVELGASLIGTCCGSTPEFTAELCRAVKGMKPLSRKTCDHLKLASRTRTVVIGAEQPFCVIGERINPTNKKELSRELLEGGMGIVRREAHEQVREGALCLDLNVGVPGGDEPVLMAAAAEAAEEAGVPLVIDTVNPEALEAACRHAAGKVLINSVSGESRSLDAVLPLAKRYGSALLCLAVDEQGIPATARQRLKILERIVDRASALGIPRRNLICDCLTLTVSAQQKRAQATLEAVALVRKTLDLPTVLGVSNISYGLPDRSVLNATFLSMAMAMGLDAAIINPDDARMMETVRAASVLTVRDRDSRSFVSAHGKKKKSSPSSKPASKPAQHLKEAVITGNRDIIERLVTENLESGLSAAEINQNILIPAIQDVGIRYDRKEIYLPQMILSAETMQAAVDVLKPHFAVDDSNKKGIVILCTVKGDVHDIGKNIVGLFLKNHGYQVVDMGKDVPAERIVVKTRETGARLVALSALMTTTMGEMKTVIDALREDGSSAMVVVGGAVVTRPWADSIGAHGYAKDAVSAAALADRLLAVDTSKDAT